MVTSSKRKVLATAGLIILQTLMTATLLPAYAAGEGLLERLRTTKVARVGIANQPPFSSLNPDGTMTGIAPTIARLILQRLGINDMQGSIATYGELIPGMLAGRWDFVAASLTITRERCSQVLFSDPLSFEGNSIVSVPGRSLQHPKTMAELIRMNATVGVPTGGAQLRMLLAAGARSENILQFNTDPALIDGLIANRIQYGWMSHLPAVNMIRQRKLTLDVVFPVADATAPGAGNAFRRQDADLHAAYQKELRAMKASGEFLKIATGFGFEIPEEFAHSTAEDQCSFVSNNVPP